MQKSDVATPRRRNLIFSDNQCVSHSEVLTEVSLDRQSYDFMKKFCLSKAVPEYRSTVVISQSGVAYDVKYCRTSTNGRIPRGTIRLIRTAQQACPHPSQSFAMSMRSNLPHTNQSEPAYVEWKAHDLPWYTEDVGNQLLPEVRSPQPREGRLMLHITFKVTG